MPAYKFKETVEEIAIERDLHLVESQNRLIWEIAKSLESRKINAEGAVEMLKANKDFRLHFKFDDFEKIRRATE